MEYDKLSKRLFAAFYDLLNICAFTLSVKSIVD